MKNVLQWNSRASWNIYWVLPNFFCVELIGSTQLGAKRYASYDCYVLVRYVLKWETSMVLHFYCMFVEKIEVQGQPSGSEVFLYTLPRTNTGFIPGIHKSLTMF
jgi:hypothetical protein